MRELALLLTLFSLLGCAEHQNVNTGMSSTLMQVGSAAEKAQRYRYAISVYQEAHRIEPSNQVIIEHLATNLARVGEYAKSSSVCQIGLTFNDNNQKLIELLSSNLLAQNRLISATHWIKKCLEYNGKNYKCLNSLGLIYDYLKDYKTSHKCYEKSLAQNPQYEQTLNNYGLSLVLDNQLDAGIDKLIASNTLNNSNVSLANLKLINKLKHHKKSVAKQLRRKLFTHKFKYYHALKTKMPIYFKNICKK